MLYEVIFGLSNFSLIVAIALYVMLFTPSAAAKRAAVSKYSL